MIVSVGWLFCASLLANYDLNSSNIPVVNESVEAEEFFLKDNLQKQEEQEFDESVESFD